MTITEKRRDARRGRFIGDMRRLFSGSRGFAIDDIALALQYRGLAWIFEGARRHIIKLYSMLKRTRRY